MSALDNLLQQVTQAVTQHGQENGYDHSGLVGQIASMFANHTGGGNNRNVVPAARDPYGDPADQKQNIKPASQDPYGDPADEPRR